MSNAAQTLLSREEIERTTEALSALDLKSVIIALVYLLAGIVITWIILSVLKRLIKSGKLEKTAGHFLVVFLRVFLLLLTFIITLDRLGLPVNSLVALISMFALAVSLSVQNVMSNVVNGIVILVNKPFRAGDYIETGSVSGTVRNITLVYTRLVTVDNRLVMVPNGSLSSAQITNYSQMPTRRLEVDVRIPRDGKEREVPDALLEAAKRVTEGEEAGGCEPPEALPVSFDGPNMHFAIRVWVPAEAYRRVNKKLLLAISEVFDERGIRMV